MKNIIRGIIEENYKNVERVGIIEFQPYLHKKDYRILTKINNIDINFVITDEVLKIYNTDKEYFKTYLISIIDNNILYYYKKGN